jgi:hypothetical protein
LASEGFEDTNSLKLEKAFSPIEALAELGSLKSKGITVKPNTEVSIVYFNWKPLLALLVTIVIVTALLWAAYETVISIGDPNNHLGPTSQVLLRI